MRTVPSALQTHLQQETTSLTTLWRLTRADGVTLGFTEHDEDIDYLGVTYKTQLGYTASALQQSSGGSVDNSDLVALLDHAELTDQELEFGRWDGAQIEIWLVNWADLSAGHVVLMAGFLGEVSTSEGQHRAELRSLSQRLSQEIGRQYALECDAVEFGDARCKADIAPWTTAGTVTHVQDDRLQFSDENINEPDDEFTYGWVDWLTGDNAGTRSAVRQHGEFAGPPRRDVFELLVPTAMPIQVGDTFNAVSGCDRKFSTCKDKYNNVVNFQGFPAIPGVDSALEYVGNT